MAELDIRIGGRTYALACRDGGEAHLQKIAALVDGKTSDAAKSMGGMSEARQLLFAALMLADELDELRTRAAAPAPQQEPDPALAMSLENLAERIESLARAAEG